MRSAVGKKKVLQQEVDGIAVCFQFTGLPLHAYTFCYQRSDTEFRTVSTGTQICTMPMEHMAELVVGDVLQFQKQGELKYHISMLTAQLDPKDVRQRIEPPQGYATLRE
jgi:hypothetical protein